MLADNLFAKFQSSRVEMAKFLMPTIEVCKGNTKPTLVEKEADIKLQSKDCICFVGREINTLQKRKSIRVFQFDSCA